MLAAADDDPAIMDEPLFLLAADETEEADEDDSEVEIGAMEADTTAAIEGGIETEVVDEPSELAEVPSELAIDAACACCIPAIPQRGFT